MNRETSEFDIFIKMGKPIPEIGKPFEAIDEDNRDDLTVYVTKIISVEWDVRKLGIKIAFEAEFDTNKYGLRVI